MPDPKAHIIPQLPDPHDFAQAWRAAPESDGPFRDLLAAWSPLVADTADGDARIHRDARDRLCDWLAALDRELASPRATPPSPGQAPYFPEHPDPDGKIQQAFLSGLGSSLPALGHAAAAILLARGRELAGMDPPTAVADPEPTGAPALPAAAGLRVIIDALLPVFDGISLTEIYWEAYSFGNLGDSAAFLQLCRAALSDAAAEPEWRAETITKLAAILDRKPCRDWNSLVAIIDLATAFPDRSEDFLQSVFINLLLLRRQLNPRLASDKSDLEYTAARLRRSLSALLGSLAPGDRLHGLVVSVCRLLPQINDQDRIGTIRALSERFDEDRADPADPWRTRANGLRKAIHQKPSEQNIALVEAYLAEQADIAAGRQAGPADVPDMIELARDLLDELRRFWNLAADTSQVADDCAALLAEWPAPSPLAQAGIGRELAAFRDAALAGQTLGANGHLTQLRRAFRRIVQSPLPLPPDQAGALRFRLISFEVAAEHLSFAYQGSLCNQYYAGFRLADLPQAIELMGQIVRSVRDSGGGDKQLGRTGMLLERENQSGQRSIGALRGVIKDILNQTKAVTDGLKRQTEGPILAMVREWKPDLGSREGESHLIAVYNSYFRSNSFLHLGEFAAFLSAALLPYGEARSQTGDETADSDRLFWRFHGTATERLPPDGELRYLVGGKAAGLLAMHAAGLPVPEGFALSTRAGRKLPPTPAGLDKPGDSGTGSLDPTLWAGVLRELAALEASTGCRFGDPEKPLLLSVRSGAPVSMPGMMDTILNIGLGKALLDARSRLPQEAAFWHDCRLHLIWLFASSVHAGLAMPKLATVVKSWYHHRDEVSRLDWSRAVLDHALELYREYSGQDFPEDPLDQLRQAVAAVFRSWNSLRAREYRAINHIPDHLGTGVTVQRMVFGNRDKRSASGVLFTRDPESGRPDFGEMVPRGQGEEVVSGQNSARDIHELESLAPEAWRQLTGIGHDLERLRGVPQDIEFTVESGRLWILQARDARLTTRGRLFALIDMVDEGLIGPDRALAELHPEALEDLDSTTFAQRDIDQAELRGQVLAHGLGVYHGVARGLAAFGIDGIRRLRARHPDCECILVKEDTKPEDIEAMYESAGCATRVGGPTSHAAINARVIGRPCVVNCTTLTIVKDAYDAIREIRVGDRVLREGDEVSLDGNRALFIQGCLPVQAPESDAASRRARSRFLAWHRESLASQSAED